jgi:hypothetical protein
MSTAQVILGGSSTSILSCTIYPPDIVSGKRCLVSLKGFYCSDTTGRPLELRLTWGPMPHMVDSRTNLPGTTIAIFQSHLLSLAVAPDIEMDVPQGASTATLSLYDLSTGAVLGTAPSRVTAILQVTSKP